MDASMGIADFQCRQILKDRYRRIAPTFPHKQNIKMDEWQKARELLQFGTGVPLADSWTGNDVVNWLNTIGW
jgi:hypothetical protein